MVTHGCIKRNSFFIASVYSLINANTRLATLTEITVNPTATDAVDGAITPVITVKNGETVITLTTGKFAATAGTYTVTITATDNAGNTATLEVTITVEAAPR
ncbi:MAG: DUF5011 domain-containing protein [Clostridiaceae bacterium]|jgi:hypothetical protein|nr:DUF5011 domain-containing protein [Clostridiaceae bacterium]